MSAQPHLVEEAADSSAPLTRRQTLIFTEHQLAPEIPSNNMVMSFELRGEIDVERFKRAFAKLVDEVDVLRTTLLDGEQGPCQVVQTSVPHDLEFVDLSDAPDSLAVYAQWRDRRSVRAFDLSELLFDAALLKLCEQHYAWYFCQHHTICDAWSFSLLFRRTSELYGEAKGGPFRSPLLPYAKYLKSEREYRGSDHAARSEEFFEQRLAEPVERINFYGVDPRGKRAALRRRVVDLGAERSHGIRALALEDDVRAVTPNLSLSLIFSTALYSLLHRVSGNETVSIGSPVANRRSRWAKQVPGLLMEVCPFRVTVEEGESFASLLAKAEQENASVLRHSRFSVGNPIHAKRFDVMLNFHNAQIADFAGIEASAELLTGLVALNALATESPAANMPWPAGDSLILQVIDFGGTGRFRLVFDLNRDVFDEAQSDRVVDHFLRLLDAFVADRHQAIASAPMLAEAERAEILSRGAGATTGVAPTGTLLERFRGIVERAPQRQAVSAGGRSLTYGGLDEKVRCLSAALREQGIGPEDLVAVCMDRSLEMLIALLATLDAGGAYIPIDPTHPTDRISLILEDAAPKLVLTQSALRERVACSGAPLLLLDPGWEQQVGTGRTEDNATPVSEAPPADRLAYVIFTSGSTGRPKGVEIEHPALTNFLTSMAQRPGLGEDDRLLAVTTVSFDIAALELFLPLTVGASVEIADYETCRDPRLLGQRIVASEISVVQATPATWQLLVDHGFPDRPGLRVFCGGEALSRELAEALCARVDEVWNLYGPTETTIWSSVERVESGGGRVTIGRPIDHTVFRILNQANEPVPDGVPGELYIGGVGLARGYCGRRDLTEERFIADPHANDDARLYRTGDRARFLPDGRVECLGRLDFQVKIRGFRIELGEIEAVLREGRGVAEALVIARGEAAQDRHLGAYLRREPGGEPDTALIAEAASEKLPSYMVPSAWMVLDAFPLNPAGKVDRRALPERVEATGDEPTGRAPIDDLEVAVAAAWRDVLNRTVSGRDDDFFDLGGNSVNAIGVLSRIQAKLGHQLSLGAFFNAPTIAGLAAAIRATSSSDPSGPAPLEGIVELQRGDGETPIFCIAGVHLYQAFARALSSRYPVYGVYLGKEHQWIEALAGGEVAELPSTESMAADYIATIREKQPAGPYRLAGLSYGGVLAFEIAHQLKHAGERVEALLLFDVRLHGRIAKSEGLLSWVRHRARRFLPRLAGRYVLRSQSSKVARVREAMSLEALEKYEHRMNPYAGSALLCRALGDYGGTSGSSDPNLGWSGLIEGEFATVDSPGGHLGILSSEHVASMREVIEAYLDDGPRRGS